MGEASQTRDPTHVLTANPAADTAEVRRFANTWRYIRLSGQAAQIIGRKQCDLAGAPSNLTAGRIGINIINPAIIWIVKSSAAQSKSITQHTAPETYLRGIISCGIERRRITCLENFYSGRVQRERKSATQLTLVEGLKINNRRSNG